MARQSFSDAVVQEPSRFVEIAFKENPNIKDFSDFDDSFRQAFNSSNGANAKIEAEDIVRLFESSYCKSKMKDNVSDKEYESLYGDGVIVERQAISKKKVITITAKKVSVPTYRTKKGKVISSYNKTQNRKFTGGEIKFLKVRKQKKISTKNIIRQYEQHFSENPRTISSLRSKVYRL